MRRAKIMIAPVFVTLVLLGAGTSSASTNLLSNGTFEGSGSGSLAGWAAVSSTLSLAADGEGGGFAGQATNASATSFGLRASPNPVNKKATAGTGYTGGGDFRSDTPGRTVCLKLLELSPTGATVATKQACTTSQSSWTALPSVAYTAKTTGDSIGYRILEAPAQTGDSFEVDNLTLYAAAGVAAPTGLQVTNATASEVDLSWTASPTPGVVSYNVIRDGNTIASVPAPGSGTTVTYADTSVAPAQTYVYAVQAVDGSGNTSPQSNTVTATTPAGTEPVIAAVGDMACDPSSPNFNGGAGTAIDCAQQRVSDAIVGDPTIQTFLGLGDYQYDCDDPNDFPLSYTPSYGRLNNIILPVVGNHEYVTGTDAFGAQCPASNNTAASYFSYFGAAAHPDTSGEYSFDLGSWHLIALNANCGFVGGCNAGSPETQWLQNDLNANTQPCILAYWHQPRWTGNGANNGTLRAWWDILYAAHADVILNGHVHNYQRFPKLNPSGVADPNGIREVIVGSGGEKEGSGSANATPQPTVRLKKFGYLRMTLQANGYSAQFIDPSGNSQDTFSDTCNS